MGFIDEYTMEQLRGNAYTSKDDLLISLKFTSHVWETLNYDLNAFEPLEKSKQIPKFINTVFSHYAHSANCSIAENEDRYTEN